MCKQRVGSEKSSLQFSKMVFTAAVLYVSPVKGIKKEGKEKKNNRDMGKQKTFSFVSFSCICLAILRERKKSFCVIHYQPMERKAVISDRLKLKRTCN